MPRRPTLLSLLLLAVACDEPADETAGGGGGAAEGCIDGQTRRCGDPSGDCTPGVQLCAGGRWGACVEADGPATESCNGQDDDCDGETDEGFELATDVAHCGLCGNACRSRPHTAAACVDGACTSACHDGWGDCDADPATGCETDLGATLSHCGRCGGGCDLPNAVATCSGFFCRVLLCDAGLADCDGDPANGCETDVRTALAHCGGCGRACAPGSRVLGAECDGGRCAITGCVEGYGSCDADFANGCETWLPSSLAHCGGCGQACVPGAGHEGGVEAMECVAGVCRVRTCRPGHADADGDFANGCEYACATRHRGVETCNGHDDDCDGEGDAADCHFEDLAEWNWGSWRPLEDEAVCGEAAVANSVRDNGDRLEGNWSLALNTSGGGGSYAVYPTARDADLDLSDATHLHVWVRTLGAVEWEADRPRIKLFWGELSYTTWTTSLPLSEQWQEWVVPLDAPQAGEAGADGSDWLRAGPTPAEAGQRVRAIYVGGDSVGCGFTMLLDGVRFLRLD